MSPTVSRSAARGLARFDFSQPVLYAFAALLCVLVVLPLSWLVYYSLVTPQGAFTLDNFRQLLTEPAFVGPLITTFIISISSAFFCCLFAAPMGWLVARTDLPMAGAIRALVTASFVTPPFLGAIAWEFLAAPNSGLLNKLYRYLTDAEPDVHLFNIYTLTGVIFTICCYTFPYVFVLVANALDRIPGDLEDASSNLGANMWTTARRITVPLAMPALLAGALVAFLQAMTLFGSPAILALPAGFHTMTTKIWSLFQYPPKPELAAAASLPLLILTVLLLRAQHFILGRRGYSVVGGKTGSPRLVPLGKWRWVAFGACMALLMLPVFLPYAALINAAFAPIATTLLTPANFTLQNVHFVFFELSAAQLALKNTFILGVLAATVGTALMAELVSGALQDTARALGVSTFFLGVIVLAVVGNAAEYFSSVYFARQGRMGLVASITVGSTIQVALLVAPILVLVSHLIGTPMNLVFDNPLELVAVASAALVVNSITRDGEATWFEGAMLLAVYALLAFAFFFATPPGDG